jgi:hypothetical protein
MKRLVILLVLGTAFGLLPGAARADELELKAAGPKDKSFQTVLSYSGDDIGKALAGGNKLKDTKKLNELSRSMRRIPSTASYSGGSSSGSGAARPSK